MVELFCGRFVISEFIHKDTPENTSMALVFFAIIIIYVLPTYENSEKETK